jgi:uncharacterized SAM-binding protein YcdF (DUF218 family)
VNALFVFFHIEAWKPLISALLLPPVPFLVLTLIGARVLVARRGLGWLLIVLSMLLMWFSSCLVTGQTLEWLLLKPPPALSVQRIAQIKKHLLTHKDTAIVVLGGGARPVSSEYGSSSLTDASLERLRYGIWLSRATGAPLAYSGGVGWGQGQNQEENTPEADIAARIAEQEFGHALHWRESQSRDTRENAANTTRLLASPPVTASASSGPPWGQVNLGSAPAIALRGWQGISRFILVTHAWHMPRAVRAFEQAAATKTNTTIEAASINGLPFIETHAQAWMPSHSGFELVRMVLHEWLGRWAGA